MMAGNTQADEPPHDRADQRDLRDLIDIERARDGAAIRSAQFWNSQAERESMTLRGRLGAAAECGEKVRLTLRSGSVHHGRIVAVGADVVAIARTHGSMTLIALPQVASMRSSERVLVTDAVEPSSETMHNRIVSLAGNRAEVRVLLVCGAEESGTVMACGDDMFVVRNHAREYSYVSLDALSEIVVL